MKIGFDAKRYFHNNTGLGNYSRTIVSGLKEQFAEDEHVLYDEKSMARTFRLGRKAKEDGCDVYVGLSNELPLDVMKAGMPSVVTIHDVAWRTFPAMYHWIDRQLYDLKYGWAAKHADRVVAISESTKRDVMRFYGVPEEKIAVVYQPVQRLFYNALTDDEASEIISTQEALRDLPKEYILSVGSINSRKNLLGTVKALERIAQDQRPPLIVIGNGREYRREVEKYIADHQMEDYVRILGNVNDSCVLQALYHKASLMMYPSFYEGFGLPVVEATLQRCPVITSTVSSLPEAMGPHGVTVNPHNQEELDAALADAIDHPGDMRQRAMLCEQYAREMFDTERLMGLFHQEIKSVTHGFTEL